MGYTVHTEYLNGATGNTFTEGAKEKIYQRFMSILANSDLRQTGKAVVINTPRGELFRYDLTVESPAPMFNEIQWPRRGRTSTVEGGVTTSAFVSEDVLEYVREKGGGNFSRGIRNMVNESKNEGVA